MLNWGTRISALAYLIITTLGFSYLLSRVDSHPLNYFIAAMADTLVVIGLFAFGCNSITRDCQIVGLGMVIAHAYGYVLYQIGAEPETYDAAQILLTAGQYARLFWNGHNDHDLTNDFRIDRIFNAHPNLH